MTEPRCFKDVARINGRPALVDVTVHPSGRRFVDLTTIEYLDAEFPPEKRARLERLAAAVDATPEQHRAAQLAAADDYRSPMRPILAVVAIVWSISCAILGAATFGTDPLTLVPFLGGMAWWCASVALGAYAYKAIRAALR